VNGIGGFARARRWIERALVLALALLAMAWYMKRRPIAPETIDASLLRSPRQSATARPPFAFEYRGKSVRVKPVAEYALDGLVMSQNDVESFADIYHDSSSVDTKDLCVLWGTSLESDDFHQVRVTNGPFTCYFRYPQGIRFRTEDLSNNHLITDDSALRNELGAVHAGDQVRVRGLLVDYQMDDWGDRWRRTSTVRNDDGCEVIFVEDFEVLRPGAPRWHQLYRVSGWVTATLPALWVILLWLGFPARAPGAASPAAARTPRRPTKKWCR
jgi:hypothetical protein